MPDTVRSGSAPELGSHLETSIDESGSCVGVPLQQKSTVTRREEGRRRRQLLHKG
ncbi:MAG: hypothetical protein VXW41_02560 [SAR324 cluster bacterium]|nr:hypothetical protein [SAR324 cluster bacterium]